MYVSKLLVNIIGNVLNIVSVSIILRNDKGFPLSNQFFFAILNCFVMPLLYLGPTI